MHTCRARVVEQIDTTFTSSRAHPNKIASKTNVHPSTSWKVEHINTPHRFTDSSAVEFSVDWTKVRYFCTDELKREPTTDADSEPW